MLQREFIAGLQLLVAASSLALVSGCAKNVSQKEEIPGENRVTVASCTPGTKVGPFQAICGENRSGIQSIHSAAAKIFLSSIQADPSKNFTPDGSDPTPAPSASPTPAPAPANASLVLGYPVGLLGEQNIFGGVITAVSDKESEKFGGLKLTDLTGLHVRTLLAELNGSPALALVGCADKCAEGSKQELLVAIPIVGIDQEHDLLALDLAALGKELDLVSMLDPNGEYTGLQAVESKTTSLDFGLSTLVFDIETKFVPKTPAPAAGQQPAPAPASTPETKFTVRWYLKLSSGFNPAFASRKPIPEVGFFQTERSEQTKITRFAFTDFGNEGVKYYIKNVPDQWQAAFKGAFDEWNSKLEPILGRKLLSYEFISPQDPRSDALVAGDIRYNIMEWDLVNKASYGGLGPSIANQFTGETFSANILIQGPTIMKLYTDWYGTTLEAQRLRNNGREADADMALLEFSLRMAQAEADAKALPKFSLKLGSKLAFRVTSQMPSYEDPIAAQRNDFDDLPDGVDFDTYMNGYFTDMVAHEMGHNLGLRHNFRGNLASDDSGRPGTVSRSIMEYLGRRFRYLDHIGPYDAMAVAYGYTGKLPDHDNWFCTDDNKIDATKPGNSAECSSDDATGDPFSWLEERLARSIDKIVARGSQDAPVWDLSNMERELAVAANGLNAYAATAEKTSSKWTNFFGKAGRPADASGVKAYVLEHLRAQLCDPNLEFVIRQKRNEEARTKTRANLEAFRAKVAELSKPWGAFTADDLKCQ